MEATRPQETEGGRDASTSSSPPGENAAPAAKSAASPAATESPPLTEVDARLQECERKLMEAEAKRDEYLDLARRIQADFANYRKRVERDRQQWQQESLAGFLREFLGYFDDFRRALAEGEKSRDFASFHGGMRLVYDNLWKAMAKAGVECIDPHGKIFDPAWHEAIATVPAGDRPPQTVVEVMQNGYRLGDIVLRPARVVVAVPALPPQTDGSKNASESAAVSN